MPNDCPKSRKASRLSGSTALGRLAFGLAAGAVAGSYGRTVEAGTCAPISGFGTYLCTGPADLFTDVTQSFGPVADDLTIVSVPGFGLDTSLSGGDGFSVRADGDLGSEDVTIVTGDVTAAQTGITVSGSGDDIRIDTTAGAIRGISGGGMDVGYDDTSSYGAPKGDVKIFTSDVSAAEAGIRVKAGSAKTITINTTNGTVSGGAGPAIDVLGESVSITTADVEGDIFVYGFSDVIKIDTAAGSVTGKIRPGSLSGSDIQIITADVIGPESGISAGSAESIYGNIRIDTTDGSIGQRDDEGTFGNGISASADNNGSIEIISGNVSSRRNGIAANIYRYDPGDENYKLSGNIKIDSSQGQILAIGGDGIFAEAFDINYGNINIVSSDIAGAQNGITARSFYSGDIRIDTTAGSVHGQQENGIDARTGLNSSSVSSPDTYAISIVTGDVSGQKTGVRAQANYSDGGIRIDTSGGSVDAREGRGIEVINLYAGDVRVTTADVSGKTEGLAVAQTSIGQSSDIIIDTTAGAIVGRNGSGIAVSQFYDANRLDIKTADVSGSGSGISVDESEGFFVATTVDTTQGTITAETGTGIEISSYGGDTSVITANVFAQTNGIFINDIVCCEWFDDNPQSNIVLDTSRGTIIARSGDGIKVEILGDGLLNVVAGNVKAAGAGIRMYSDATSTIQVIGEIDGGTGIDGKYDSGPTRLATSGLIQGRDGVAIDLRGASSAKVEIFDQLAGQSSATQGIIGRTFFGDGDDTLSFIDTTGPTNILYDGVFASLFDGGDGTDRVNFSVGLDNLTQVGGGGSLLDLFFTDGAGESALLSFVNFELFTFTDDPAVTYTVDDLRSLGSAVTPVPLPAGIALLGGALALAGLVRSRRRPCLHATGTPAPD